ncbi:MAG: GNVR domain-containing protein, partial [candidate division Zixibacteria bacterium]|nr:GNVR domain-containing protein [candidate division Zixibacteria bacterium]
NHIDGVKIRLGMPLLDDIESYDEMIEAIEFKFPELKDDEGIVRNLTLSGYFNSVSSDLLHSALLGITDISVDKKTGVINIGVTTEYPGLSQKILESFLAELENFNLYKRASQAKDNEQYLSKQLASRQNELKQLEDKFEEFQKNNRDWLVSSNPEINIEVARFKRKLEVSTKAVILLYQEYEMAKLEAMKDIPIVRILDTPSIPDQKNYPKRTLILVLITLISLLMTCFGVLIYEAVSRYTSTVDNEISHMFKSTTNRVNKIFSTRSRTENKDKVDI